MTSLGDKHDGGRKFDQCSRGSAGLGERLQDPNHQHSPSQPCVSNYDFIVCRNTTSGRIRATIPVAKVGYLQRVGPRLR